MKHSAVIFLPIYLLLIAKAVAGARMVFNRFKKSFFTRYYVVSWSFYWSSLTQLSLILFTSWQILKLWVACCGVALLCALIPAWVIMNIHDQIVTQQCFELINEIKKGKVDSTGRFLMERQLLLQLNNNQLDEKCLPSSNQSHRSIPALATTTLRS